MRLELMTPPALVSVDGRPALLIATRGERCYVQVSRGTGSNHLGWVPAEVVRPPAGADPRELPVEPPLPISSGLPWIRGRSER